MYINPKPAALEAEIKEFEYDQCIYYINLTYVPRTSNNNQEIL